MDKVFKGDIGTKIILDADSDISTATELKIVYRKPSGAVGSWTAVAEGTQQAYYIITASDLDEVGKWEFQLYVKLPSWSGYGEISGFTVYENFEVP